jgi:DNA-binding transcriptional regulator GbsR (MarR family)
MQTDEDAVARFVERFALLLADAGMTRMPARVFTRLLVTDSGRLTASELADALTASPAAISGAVRYLDQLGLVTKGREPGERRDHYAVSHDLWFEAYANRDKQFETWASVLGEGIQALAADTRARARLAESRRFFLFLRDELPRLMERWRQHEAAAKAAASSS